MYRKNTAGQFLCVQLLLTATGAVGTGLTPAVRRCLDGTFAAGGGTFTEDGTTGSYKYAMSQGDTNANNVSIIITATGCIPVCVNFVTTAADPTNATTFGLTNLTTPLTAAQIAAGVWQDTTAGDFTTALSVGKSLMNGVALGTGLTVNDITTKTNYALTAAYDLAKTAAQAGDAMALTAGERNSTADALLNRDMSTGADSGSTTVRTVRQALRFNRNKVSISAGTMTVTKEDDVTASWTAAITTTAGDPITAIDPAGP